MRLSKTTRYGRFLVGAAVLFSLLACERKRPRTIEEVVAAAKTVRLPDSLRQAQKLVQPPQAVSKAVALPGDILPVEDSVRAYIGGRPMQYRVVPAAHMAGYAVGADTVLGRFLLMRELDERMHFLYPVTSASGDWIDVRLERVGEHGIKGADIAVDTIRLQGQPKAALCVSAQGHQGSWGGSADTRCMQLLDISGLPALLMKVENSYLNTSYGRLDDTTYDEDAESRETQEQTVKFRDGMVFVSTPRRRVVQGARRERVSPLRPVPETMLPAGQYRYQYGQLYRVEK